LKRFFQALAIGLICATMALLLWQAGWLERWESRTWDLRVARFARPGPATPQIRLIFLDQYSLDWGKEKGWSWPWPRQVYGPVIDFCRRAGARAVAFDVIFSEPSVYGVEDDEALGAAVAASPNFVGAVFVGRKTGGVTNWPADVRAPAARLETSVPRSMVLPRAAFPVPEVATNAALLATVFGNPSRDGVYRKTRPFSVFDGQVVPSLGLGAYLASTTNRALSVSGPWLHIAGRPTPVPLDRWGNAILHFRGRSQTHRTVNIAAVIESELRLKEGQAPLIDPASFSNTYVLLGFTAPGLLDLRSSPVSPVYPGVEIHATFLDNLLAGDFMREAPRPLTVALAIILALLAAFGVRFSRGTGHTVLMFAIILPLPAALGFWAYSRGLWLPIVVQAVAATPALIAALAVNYATEGKEKRFIKGAFKQYLSPLVIDELVQHPEQLQLGGATRELSILFSDLRGFSGISEHLSPEQLTGLLNDYLTAMTEIIYRHGGTVDKYEGDAVIAFWNAPVTQPDHAHRAVQAALEYQAALTALRPDLKARYGHDLFARIGLNTGPVVVGNMGSRQRFNYTFLGDAGNLASRLEGINKQFATPILISEATRTRLPPDVPVREISQVQVVGRKEPVRVFEPLTAGEALARRELLTRFAAALAAYYTGRFDEAASIFTELQAQDATSAIYAARCRDLAAHPPAGWTGVWVMTEK
jgi:adenylate cyclase